MPTYKPPECKIFTVHKQHYYTDKLRLGTGTFLCSGIQESPRPYDVWTDFHSSESLLRHCPKESLPYIFPGAFIVLGDHEGNRAAGIVTKVDYSTGLIVFEITQESFVPSPVKEEGI